MAPVGTGPLLCLPVSPNFLLLLRLPAEPPPLLALLEPVPLLLLAPPVEGEQPLTEGRSPEVPAVPLPVKKSPNGGWLCGGGDVG